MKHFLLCTLAALLIATSAGIVGDACAQNPKIHHRIAPMTHQNPQLGRDCWFSVMDLGGNLPGTYYTLYVTSPSVTTVHIHITGGITKTIALTPYKTAMFNIPFAWVMQSSGHVDDFGIHVWSSDADISCNVMEHGPYGTDGMYILPTIGWGTEYVLAAAGAYHSTGIYQYDLPSVFAVVANQDNTRVSIMPTCDLRVESSSGGCCSCILASSGQAFQVVLNAGQSVQFKSTCEQDCENFDVTGTVITSNNPIGVEAGAEVTRIPCTYNYASPVFEMMPPVRTWGENYYSVPFYQAPNTPPGHNRSRFLVITTRPGQTIYRYDNSIQQTQVVFVGGGKKYDTYSIDTIDQGSHWSSDAPFLLVQYMNSSTYPTSDTGVRGEPSEVILPSSDNYTKTVTFQVPPSNGNQIPFTNYVNIITYSSDKHSTLDGQPLLGLHQFYIDGVFTGYRAMNVSPGAHIVKADTAAGVYVYGYASDGESYSWPAGLPTSTYNSQDTTPPVVDTSGSCYTAHIALSDIDGDFGNVGMYYIRLDSNYNMSYTLDPTWLDGKARTTSYYDMAVTDITKPAALVVSVFDASGNSRTTTSTYTPQTARIGPPLLDFGTGSMSTWKCMYDTIVNTGKVPFVFTSLKLVLGDQGIALDSAMSAPLAVGEKRFIKICFQPVKGTNAYDTLRMSDGCTSMDAILTGNGGGPDFRVTGHDWGTVLLGTSIPFPGTSLYPIEVVNTSATQPIQIDSIWVDDSWHFVPLVDTNWPSHSKPVTIPAKGHHPFTFTFHATAGVDQPGLYKTLYFVRSNQLVGPGETGIRSNILTANVISSSETFTADTTLTMECVDALQGTDTAILRFEITPTGGATSIIKKIAHHSTWNAMKNATNPNDLFVSNFSVQRDNGMLVANPAAMTEQLQTGSKLFITDTFIAPMFTSGVYVDTFWAYDLDQATGTTKLIGVPLTARVNVVYRVGLVSNDGLMVFKPMAYKSAPDCQTFTITDTSSTPLQIDTLYINPLQLGNAPYVKAFWITTTPPLPAILMPGDVMTVSVCFDPSVSDRAVQPVWLTIGSNSCIGMPFEIVGQIINGSGVSTRGADYPTATLVQTDDGLLRAVTPADWTVPIRVEIETVLGARVLDALLDGNTLDASALATGVYFYRITSGNHEAAGKILITR